MNNGRPGGCGHKPGVIFRRPECLACLRELTKLTHRVVLSAEGEPAAGVRTLDGHELVVARDSRLGRELAPC